MEGRRGGGGGVEPKEEEKEVKKKGRKEELQQSVVYLQTMQFSVEKSQRSGVGSFRLDVILRLADVLHFAHPQCGCLGEVAQIHLQRCFTQL